MKSKEGLFFVLRHFVNKFAQLCYILGQKKRLFDAFPDKKRKELFFSKCLPEFALIIILIYPFIR